MDRGIFNCFLFIFVSDVLYIVLYIHVRMLCYIPTLNVQFLIE